MKIHLGGKFFDTAIAKKRFPMVHPDATRTDIKGALFISSADTWYMIGPDIKKNFKDVRVVKPSVVFEQFSEYFTDAQLVELATVAGVTFE